MKALITVYLLGKFNWTEKNKTKGGQGFFKKGLALKRGKWTKKLFRIIISEFMTSTYVLERMPTPQLTEARTKDSEKFRRNKIGFQKKETSVEDA